MLDEAFKLAEYAHEGQKRYTGEPYITHPLAVAEMVKGMGFGIDYQVVAVLHDAIEDYPKERGDYDDFCRKVENLIGESLYNSVWRLTHLDKEPLEDYINQIKEDKIATIVKMADRTHNIKSAIGCNYKWIKKYIKETEEYYYIFFLEMDAKYGTNFMYQLQTNMYHLKEQTFGIKYADTPYSESEEVYAFDLFRSDNYDAICYMIKWDSLTAPNEIFRENTYDFPETEDKEFGIWTNEETVERFLKHLRHEGHIIDYKYIGPFAYRVE